MKHQSNIYSKRGTLGGYKIILLLLCATSLVSFSAIKPTTNFSGKWYDKKEAISCNGQYYMGYIFDRSFLVYKSIDLQQSRVNLTCDDIKIAEKILNMKLASLEASKFNQTKDCPNILKELPKFCRQYFGYRNTRGEVIIWINMFWNNNLKSKAKYELIGVDDGCSKYWNIEVNITKNSLSKLYINGNG